MEDFKQLYFNIPPLTRYFCTGVFVITFTVTYLKMVDPSYFLLVFDDVFFKLQLWRLVTNAMFVGKFSFSFVFFTIMMYFRLSKMENRAIQDKLYGEFVMMLLYCLAFIYVAF